MPMPPGASDTPPRTIDAMAFLERISCRADIIARAVNFLDSIYTNIRSIFGYTDCTETGERKGTAMDVFDSGAVLFASEEEGERLRIECAVTPEGSLRIVQESSGPLTQWSFRESPHTVEAVIDPAGVGELLGYFHLDAAHQLPAVLRLEYTGYECFSNLCDLMKRLGIPYEIREAAIVR